MECKKAIARKLYDKNDISAYNQTKNVIQELRVLCSILNSSSFYNSTIQDVIECEMIPTLDTYVAEIGDSIISDISDGIKDVIPYRT